MEQQTTETCAVKKPYTTEKQTILWELKNFDGKEDIYKSEEYKFEGYTIQLTLTISDKESDFTFAFSGLPDNTYCQAAVGLRNCYDRVGIQGKDAFIYKSDTKPVTLCMGIPRAELSSVMWLNEGSLKFDFVCIACGDAKEFSLEPAAYAGLENQGATCYMNALLQSLFHLPAFRRLVYDMPTTGTEDAKSCIPLNLQRLFCRMQISTDTCQTTALTNSFGWGSIETIMQHDIQEFSRVLLDNLETKMKGTDLESSIPNLFRGKTRSYIRCKNVNFESSRVEDFYDLTMVVKDCANLRESFEKFTETEVLDGDNQYQTDEFGKQDAIMGVEFLEFPSILQIHLSRFIYDYYMDRMIKLYDKFMFEKEIDLTDFLAKDADHTKSNVFELYGVLVHYGSVQAGHYYAFLRTSTSTEWFRFNDSEVTKSTEKMAVIDNYGGEIKTQSQYKYRSRSGMKKKPYSAYMLVYVRKEDAHRIFEPIPESSIPEHLRKYVEQEIKAEENYAEEEQAYESGIKIAFSTEDSLIQRTLLSKTGFKEKNLKKHAFDVTTKNRELYNFAAKELGKEVSKIRLWNTGISQNPTDVIPNNDEYISFPYMDYYKSFQVFVQDKNETEPVQLPSDEITVFVKFFIPNTEFPIQYIGAFQINKKDTFMELAKKVGAKVNVSASKLSLFVETIGSDASVQELDMKVDDTYISTGNILIFQVFPEFADRPSIKMQKPLPVVKEEKKEENSDDSTDVVNSISYDDKSLKKFSIKDLIEGYSIKSYPEYLASNFTTKELRIISLDNLKEPKCIISMPTKTPYPTIKQCIAKSCGIEYDPLKDSILLFHGNYSDDSKPSISPIDQGMYKNPYNYYQSKNGQVSNMFFTVFKGVSEHEIKDMSLNNVQFTIDGIEVAKEDRILVPKSATCEDIKNAFFAKNKEFTNGECRFNQIYSEMSYSDQIKPDEKLPYSGYTLRISLIPEDQKNLEYGDVNVKVKIGELSSFGNEVFSKEIFIKVCKEDKFGEVKEKIMEIIKPKEEQKKKIKFHFIKDYMSKEIALNDDDLVAHHVFNDSYISVITGEQKPYHLQKEAAVKIFN